MRVALLVLKEIKLNEQNSNLKRDICGKSCKLEICGEFDGGTKK